MASETTYQVQRERWDSDLGSWVETTFLARGLVTTSWKDRGVPPGIYRYRVRAQRNGELSNFTDWVEAEIDSPSDDASPPFIRLRSFFEISWNFSLDLGTSRIDVSKDPRPYYKQPLFWVTVVGIGLTLFFGILSLI